MPRGTLERNQALLASDNEDCRKFKALCRMERQERNLFSPETNSVIALLQKNIIRKRFVVAVQGCDPLQPFEYVTVFLVFCYCVAKLRESFNSAKCLLDI